MEEGMWEVKMQFRQDQVGVRMNPPCFYKANSIYCDMMKAPKTGGVQLNALTASLQDDFLMS